MNEIKVGYALCGSFCTFSRAIPAMQMLVERGAEIIPIMSENAYTTDTRFGNAKDIVSSIEAIAGKSVIHTIAGAEPIGPKCLLDVLVIAPCTGNTLAKLACGVTDTPVTMAAKAHLRNGRPLVLALATNDGLTASAKNIGALMNTKHIFFVPFQQDDCVKKSSSLIAHFELIPDVIEKALKQEQYQPMLSPLYDN